MYVEDKYFKPPQNKNQKIWRYLDFTKFVDLLATSSVHFTRADLFTDKFEGSITAPTAKKRDEIMRAITEDTIKREESHKINFYKNDPYLIEQYKRLMQQYKWRIAINCWHMNDFESAAMWKVYLQSKEGIAIQSTYSRLVNTINNVEMSVKVGVVDYKDYDNDEMEVGNVMIPYLHKLRSFEHEKELRMIIQSHHVPKAKPKEVFPKSGYKIKINLNSLIEAVYISPDSQQWFTTLVENVVSRYGYNFPIKNSWLSGNPIY